MAASGATCTFEHLGWRCNGKGLVELGPLEPKPCPRCNTAAFLGGFLPDAQRPSLELGGVSLGCLCCAPPLIRVQWTSAVEIAQACNPAAAAAFLQRLPDACVGPVAPDIDDYLGELGPLTPIRR